MPMRSPDFLSRVLDAWNFILKPIYWWFEPLKCVFRHGIFHFTLIGVGSVFQQFKYQCGPHGQDPFIRDIRIGPHVGVSQVAESRLWVNAIWAMLPTIVCMYDQHKTEYCCNTCDQTFIKALFSADRIRDPILSTSKRESFLILVENAQCYFISLMSALQHLIYYNHSKKGPTFLFSEIVVVSVRHCKRQVHRQVEVEPYE